MSGRAASEVSPVALLLVLAVLFQEIWFVFPQSQKAKEEEYAKRPYKFQFNIEDHHHRKEEKNDKGIIMGEFGFVTADFFYLTTVYATDEEGKFHILARSRKYIGPPTEKPPTKTVATTRRPPIGAPSPQVGKPFVEPGKQPIPAKKPKQPFSGLTGCSSCVVPTTTKKPTIGGNAIGGKPFLGAIGGPGIGGIIPPAGPGIFDVSSPIRPGSVGPSTPFRPGVGGPATSLRPGVGGPATSLRPGVGGPTTSLRPGVGGPATSLRPGVGGPTTSFKPGVGGLTTSFRPGQGAPVSPGSFRPSVPGINVPPGSRPGLGGKTQQAERPVGSGGSGLVKEDPGGPNYKFNYTVGFHGHHEIGYRGGSKEGGYFANHRDGEGQRVVYEANEFGYQPNVTKVRLSDAETPKEETEKDYGLKGYEFKWFN